jgi:hypothetical protein
LLVVGCELDADDINEESGSAKSGLRTSISPVYKQKQDFIKVFKKKHEINVPERDQDIHILYNLHLQVLHHLNHLN